MPSGFRLGPRNLVVAERFSLGTSPVDWPGFFWDPETEVPERSQHRGEHNSLVGDVQRTIDVQTLKRPDKLSKGGFKEHASLEVQRAVDFQPVEQQGKHKQLTTRHVSWQYVFSKGEIRGARASQEELKMPKDSSRTAKVR